MVIFDELEYAEEIEKENITTVTNCVKKGCMLAKLYFHNGCSEEEVNKLLNQKFAFVSDVYGEKIKDIKIKAMINYAKKKPCIEPRSINFSKEELDFIHENSDTKITEKVFFMLLAFSKYYSNSFYFSDRELLRYCKTGWNGYYSKNSLKYIIQHGYFQVTEKLVSKDSNYRKIYYYATDKITNLYNPDNIVMGVIDYRNLIYRYMNYFGMGDFIYCCVCGKIEKKTGIKQKYCKECGKKISTLQRLSE